MQFNQRQVWFYSIVLVISASILFQVNFSQAYEKGKAYKIVYFNPDVTIEDPITAVSAMKPFSNYLGKKLGVKFEIFFFKKQVDLNKFLDNNKVAFGIFSQLYIVENFRKRNFVPVLLVLKEGQPFYRKVILVRKDSKYESLDDLKGKSLATTALGDDNIPFLNKVVFRSEINVKTHFGKLNVVDSANSAIMAVLYKQADAAAANYLNYVFLKELKPQVGKQLKVIFTSAKTPLPGLVYFKGAVPKDLEKKSVNEMLVMHKSPIGSQTMLAFQVEAWGKASIDDWAGTAKLLGISLTGEPSKVPSNEKTIKTSSQKKTTEKESISPKKKEETIVFKRIVAHHDVDNNLLAFKVRLLQKKLRVKPDSIQIHYTLSQGEKGKILLKSISKDEFSGELHLPKVKKTSENQRITYIIKPGDTLGKIAEKTLGDSKKYMVIARLNKIKNPNLIFAGKKLNILRGEFNGLDVNYRVFASDQNGKEYKSREKFISIVF